MCWCRIEAVVLDNEMCKTGETLEDRDQIKIDVASTENELFQRAGRPLDKGQNFPHPIHGSTPVVEDQLLKQRCIETVGKLWCFQV
jgi:hypothetical protein